MKLLRLIVWSVTAALGVLPAQGSPPLRREEINLKGQDASAGDLLKAEWRGRSVLIRLWGVRCPEPTSRWGRAARFAARGKVQRKALHLVIHGEDTLGKVRFAGEVFFGKQRDSLNELLVQQGLARADTQFTDLFLPQERSAQRTKRGLWMASPEQL